MPVLPVATRHGAADAMFQTSQTATESGMSSAREDYLPLLVVSDQKPSDGNTEADEMEEAILQDLISYTVKREELQRVLKEYQDSHVARCKPLEMELVDVLAQVSFKLVELESIRASRFEDGPPPGPKCLRWVDGDMYNLACMVVIFCNFATMILELTNKDNTKKFWLVDQIFLCWYVSELVLKVTLFQRKFFVGPCTMEVFFHYLDLIIVLSGIFDQWVLPALGDGGHSGKGHGNHLLPFQINPSSLRALRILRVTRMLRLVKALNLLFNMDLAWADGKEFECICTVVIFINSITMGMELDIQWDGWVWVNMAFLCVYTFETLLKMKRHKWNYFTHDKLASWHWLDFVIVSTGIVEMCGIPAYHAIMFYVTGAPAHDNTKGSILSVIRILRLLRVLRLYKLLTFSKSLRKLVTGIADAMHGTIWVIILTFVVLYIFAIIFTTLVGQGMVFDKGAPPEAQETFGSVEQSLYMLFKLMNDDQSVVMFTNSVWVRLLFMLSMVVLNWVMLATLTSVVTDHMNSATSRADKEEEEKNNEVERQYKANRLMDLFEKMDIDGNGLVERKEFEAMLMKHYERNELMESTGLKGGDLAELFEYLSHDTAEQTKVINYEDFIEKLTAQGKTATEKAIYRLESQMRQAEKRNQQRFDNLITMLEVPSGERKRLATTAVTLPGPEQAEWRTFARQVELQEQEEELQLRKDKIKKGLDVDDADVTPSSRPRIVRVVTKHTTGLSP
mmetsp:Transcript_139594/g.446687  ORF Transcript_139594/g.446687 Transcript_139594/m.446687 type:complete len:734 (-) Transcript_139594:403-2604(-)